MYTLFVVNSFAPKITQHYDIKLVFINMTIYIYLVPENQKNYHFPTNLAYSTTQASFQYGLKGTTEHSLDRIIQSRSPTQLNPTQYHTSLFPVWKIHL